MQFSSHQELTTMEQNGQARKGGDQVGNMITLMQITCHN